MIPPQVNYTIGEVYLTGHGGKRSIEAIPFKKSVILKDGDKISTLNGSYVEFWDDVGTWIIVFPNSELTLGIKGITIISTELIKGLFNIRTSGIKVITPTTDRLGQAGVLWVDVAGDTVVVASETGPIEVVHKKTKKSVVIGFRQQVTVTQEAISEPCDVDQRFKEAYKVGEMLEQSKAKFLYGDMLKRQVPQELKKLVKEAEKVPQELERLVKEVEEIPQELKSKEVEETEQELKKLVKEAKEKTGRKEDLDLTKAEKWLKEQKEFGEWKYEEAVESKLPEFKQQKTEEKTIPIAKPTTTDINKSVNYQEVDFNIISAEREEMFKGRYAPKGKDFLILSVEAKNNSTKQVFVFYDEEVRLINESGETISLENYKLETSFDPKTETKGFLLFIVTKEDKKFRLQLGKKSVPEAEVSFEFSRVSI